MEATTEVPNWTVRRLSTAPGYVEVAFHNQDASPEIQSFTLSLDAARLMASQLAKAIDD